MCQDNDIPRCIRRQGSRCNRLFAENLARTTPLVGSNRLRVAARSSRGGLQVLNYVTEHAPAKYQDLKIGKLPDMLCSTQRMRDNL